jgi:hypothetical protein
MADLRSHRNGSLSQELRLNPLPHIRALEAACHAIALEERPGYDKEGTLGTSIDHINFLTDSPLTFWTLFPIPTN